MLKNYRTKISGYLASVIPASMISGFTIEPDMVIQILTDYGTPVICAQLLTSLGVQYYRDQANGTNAVINHAEHEFDKVEDEITELAGGNFEDD